MHSTSNTAYITGRVGDDSETKTIETPERTTPLGQNLPPFVFVLQEEEQKSLSNLHSKYSTEFPLAFPQSSGLELAKKLRAALEKLNQIESKFDPEEEHSQDKLLINQYRSAIIKAFENHLQQCWRPTHHEENQVPVPLWKGVLRYLSYGLVLGVGMLIDGIGSFLGGQQLITLIPGISGPLGMTLGIIFSLINSALFYSFEGSMLKRMVGLDSSDDISKQLEMDEEQMRRAGKINGLMLNLVTDKLDPTTYAAYAGLSGTINDSIFAKEHLSKQNTLPEKKWHRILRQTLTGVGALMVSGYSYFMVNSLMVFFAPAIIGTPLGWTLIGIGVITMLAYYFAMRGKAMVNMLNPASQKFKETKAQFSLFERKHTHDFENAYALKSQLSTLESEKRTLLGQVETLTRQKNGLLSKVDTLTRGKKDLLSQREPLEKETGQHLGELEKMSATNAELSEKVAPLKKSN